MRWNNIKLLLMEILIILQTKNNYQMAVSRINNHIKYFLFQTKPTSSINLSLNLQYLNSPMQKQPKKEKDPHHKLQKKLQKPGTCLQQILQQESVVQSFRANNALLHNFLRPHDYQTLIEYVTVLAPEDDKLRAYKYPQVACDILSSEIPKIWEVMFMVVDDAHQPHILLQELLRYFDDQPHYTLSGYVIKILTSLYFYEPVRVQQALVESGKLPKMVNFASSRSVSEFLVKVVVVENEAILTSYFKERRDLFSQIMTIYDKNDREEEFLAQISQILAEIMNKLWGNKHKELGRFSQSLLQLVQIIISKQKLCNQQNLMLIVIKHLSNYIDDAPYLIKAILSKSYKEVSANSFDTFKSTHKTPVTKFGAKKLKLLQCLSAGFTNCIHLVQSLQNLHVYFTNFLNLMVKHEWNNLLHVEIQTIFRETFKNGSVQLFKAMFQKGRFGESVKDLIKKQERKQQKGYLGVFINIVSAMNQGVLKSTEFGKYLKREEPKFVQIIEQFLKPKQSLYVFDLAGYSVNLKNSIPRYEQAKLLELHKDFLDNANQTLATELIKSISSTSDNTFSQTLNNEIWDENAINSKFYQDSSLPDKPAA